MNRLFFKKESFSKEFITSKLTNFIKNRALAAIDSKAYIEINKYLRINYSKSLNEIVKIWAYNLECSRVGDYWKLELSSTAKIKDTPLNNIVRLIDDGNRQVKGLNFFNKQLDYINKNKYIIYRYYKIDRRARIWE